MSDLFGIYDNALTDKECNLIVDTFESDAYPKTPGMINVNGKVGVHKDSKDCKEIYGNKFSNNSVVDRILLEALNKHIKEYFYKYLNSAIDLKDLKINDGFNLSKYDHDSRGFTQWHFEQANCKFTVRRILVWMFYFNNAKSGTEFLFQRNIKPKKGRLIIWPAAFTHTHRAQKNKGLKYFSTGWVNFSLPDWEVPGITIT